MAETLDKFPEQAKRSLQARKSKTPPPLSAKKRGLSLVRLQVLWLLYATNGALSKSLINKRFMQDYPNECPYKDPQGAHIGRAIGALNDKKLIKAEKDYERHGHIVIRKGESLPARDFFRIVWGDGNYSLLELGYVAAICVVTEGAPGFGGDSKELSYEITSAGTAALLHALHEEGLAEDEMPPAPPRRSRPSP